MADIFNMTVDQLEQHILEVEQLLKKKKAEQVEENRQKIEAYAKSLGTSVEELYGTPKPQAKTRSRKRAVLYVDDTGKEFYRSKKEWSEDEKARFKKNAATG